MNGLSKISFCLTEEESKTVDAARQRLAVKGVFKNQSEVIRAAIRMLSSTTDTDLVSSAEEILQLKPGRKRIGR